MSIFAPVWGSWQTTSINGSTITNSSTATTAAITTSGAANVVEIGVQVTYGAGISDSVYAYVCRAVDSGVYEGTTDLPQVWSIAWQSGGSTTQYRAFTVVGDLVSDFKILLLNSSGQSATCTVKYRLGVITSN